MTPYDTLNRRAARQPDATAFIVEDESWSYGRLLEATDRLAAGLAARGVRPGDRVALHMRNRPELFVSYLACFRLGAIAAPINTRLKTGEVRSLLRRLQARLYLGQDALTQVVADIEEEVLPLGARFASGGAAAGRAGNWNELLSASGETPPAAPGDEDALVALLTTRPASPSSSRTPAAPSPRLSSA